MKLPFEFLLLGLALTVSVRAEEAMPVKTEVAVVKWELVWPEIKDPQALIAHAKNLIEGFNRDHPGVVQNINASISHEFDYLKPRECWLGRASLAIIFDTHPYNGQSVLITPDSAEYWEHHKQQLAEEIRTKNPEISFGLAPISPHSSGLFEKLTDVRIEWTDFRNLDKETSSWPQPLDMQFPAYPLGLVRIGVYGRS